MSKLRLVSTGPGGYAESVRSRWPVALAALLLAAGALATLRGADGARRNVSPREIASEALGRALQRGSEDDSVREALIELRRRLGRRPLDSAARVAYASLLLGVSRSVEETRAAAFHADLAADLSPVTVPVVRASAVILARSGETERAVRRVRSMFEYDPVSAADLLDLLSPGLDRGQIASSIADTPEAWIAWLRRLRRDGRDDEADLWLERAFDRWPDHPETLERMVALVVRREDWAGLQSLFATGREIPERPSGARTLTFRALARALAGDAQHARADVATALRLAPDDPRVQLSAGDAHASLGDHDQARRLWSRALFAFEREGATESHRQVLLRLARLEHEHGEPAAALRLWRSVLELDPGHGEARRRVEDLTGFRR